MGLKENALLINLKISQWAGRKFDRRATESVELSHKTAGHVGNFNKRLLPGAKELEAVSQITGKIRKFHYDRTLPWASDGTRIIKSTAYVEFMTEFRKLKNEFESAVNQFLGAYPALKIEAQNALGDLYSEADYPEVSKLENSFKCELTPFPIPDASDFRVKVSEQDQKQLQETIDRATAEAKAEVFTRLYDVVSKATTKLNEPDAIFRNSLLGNIAELCDLLPSLNVLDDPELDRMTAELQRVINSTSTEDCRKSSETRKATAKELEAIQDRLGAFMGGAQ